ncbi:unnamed protein product [Symbiodinium natans]|uniref:Uncharacterized protein n=1 Tax=Symbiodinium natans TaxID=878477 RepID=A0A812N2G3_9DINO|nr:unnamed protein product [Symbiodinium natans]
MFLSVLGLAQPRAAYSDCFPAGSLHHQAGTLHFMQLGPKARERLLSAVPAQGPPAADAQSVQTALPSTTAQVGQPSATAQSARFQPPPRPPPRSASLQPPPSQCPQRPRLG